MKGEVYERPVIICRFCGAFAAERERVFTKLGSVQRVVYQCRVCKVKFQVTEKEGK